MADEALPSPRWKSDLCYALARRCAEERLPQVESLSVSGMGSILWTSTLSSAPASVAMIVPLAPVGVRLRRVVGTESTAARHPARHLPLALGIHGAGYREMFLAHTNAPADHLHGQR